MPDSPEKPPETIEDVWRLVQRLVVKSEVAVQERKLADIEVTISAANDGPRFYNIDIENSGPSRFTDIDVDYRRILLWAERFSLDTTHMPKEHCYISGEPIHVDRLDAGQRVRLVRKGHGTHDRYDGPKVQRAVITFTRADSRATADDKRWCNVIVQLPNARA
jgi:hypothetical protein